MHNQARGPTVLRRKQLITLVDSSVFDYSDPKNSNEDIDQVALQTRITDGTI
ncbi:hypothetical protein KEM48_004366, partial [Puccinia striiformis f. sp. tritici PST-130]